MKTTKRYFNADITPVYTSRKIREEFRVKEDDSQRTSTYLNTFLFVCLFVFLIQSVHSWDLIFLFLATLKTRHP